MRVLKYYVKKHYLRHENNVKQWNGCSPLTQTYKPAFILNLTSKKETNIQEASG